MGIAISDLLWSQIGFDSRMANLLGQALQLLHSLGEVGKLGLGDSVAGVVAGRDAGLE